MDEAAANDMTVRFVFDAEQGLSRIQKVKKGLMGIYESTEKNLSIFEKTIGFVWRMVKALSKLWLVYKTFPTIFNSIKTNFLSTDKTMREKLKLFGQDMNVVFEKVFTHGFWGGAKRQFFNNIREIATGQRKLSGFFTGVGSAIKKDIKTNAPAVEKMGEGIAGKFQNIGKKIPLVGIFKDVGSAANGLLGTMGKLAFGPELMGFLKALGKASLIVGAIVIGVKALVGVYKKLVDVGLQAEASFTKMRILLGSDKAAVGMMGKAEKFSLVTKYTPLEVAQAAAKVTAFGMKAPFEQNLGDKKDTSIMQTAAGMAAVSGLGLDHAVRALMKGEQALLDEYVHAREAHRKLVDQGIKIGTAEFRKRFVEEVAKIPEYMRASKIESQTVAGLWSTIAGANQSMWTAMSGAGRDSEEIFNFWNQIRDILKEWAESSVAFADVVKPLLREIGATFGLALKAIWDIIGAIGSVLAPILKVVGGLLYGLLFGVFRIVNIILWVITKIAQSISWVFDSLYGKIADLGAFLFGWLIDPIKTLFKWIQDIWTQISINIIMLKLYFSKGFVEVAKDLWNFILKIVNKISEVLSFIGGGFVDIIGKGAALLKKKVQSTISKDEAHENVHGKYKTAVSSDKSVKNVSYDQSRTNIRKKTTNININVSTESAINPFNMAGAQ